jgi:hypothetical protein
MPPTPGAGLVAVAVGSVVGSTVTGGVVTAGVVAAGGLVNGGVVRLTNGLGDTDVGAGLT